MRVISWAKAFVVVGRGSSYLFVSMIQNQEFAASLEGDILGEWEWKSKEVKSGRSLTLSSTMADSTKRNLTEDQKKASPWRDSILWTFFTTISWGLTALDFPCLQKCLSTFVDILGISYLAKRIALWTRNPGVQHNRTVLGVFVFDMRQIMTGILKLSVLCFCESYKWAAVAFWFPHRTGVAQCVCKALAPDEL